MREIKFRGRKSNGEWLYGDLVTTETTDGQPSKFNIRPYDVDLECPEDVEENTIGQFTGVLDKNGNEIYEGDVLSVREWKNLAFGMFNHDEMKDLSLDDCKGELLKDIKSLVYWDEGSMLATEQNGCAYYMCSFWHKNTLITQPIFDIEIIGNIHDNPELLNKLRLW